MNYRQRWPWSVFQRVPHTTSMPWFFDGMDGPRPRASSLGDGHPGLAKSLRFPQRSQILDLHQQHSLQWPGSDTWSRNLWMNGSYHATRKITPKHWDQQWSIPLMCNDDQWCQKQTKYDFPNLPSSHIFPISPIFAHVKLVVRLKDSKAKAFPSKICANSPLSKAWRSNKTANIMGISG